jgi:catecholate siderophore receptor
MSATKSPLSFRTFPSATPRKGSDLGIAAAVCLGAIVTGHEAGAQQAARDPDALPSLTVEAPAAPRKKKPAKPRTAARTTAPAASVPATVAVPPAGSGGTGGTGATAGADPYADPAAPYKVDRSASTKLTQPILDTPRTITAIPKEVIEDKGATSLRELVRTTPGLTLGTGEGGNAFGDRVFIRGFDARNDMYVNGVRESGVTTRETFMTEQVEVVKGPAGTLYGRGTAGGAVNIVTKQAAPNQSFREVTTTFGTDATKRLTADVNQVISPDLSIRFNGLLQASDVAGRDHVFDNRWGGSFAALWRPRQDVKLSLDYYHVSLDQMPDWGIPFDPRTRRPFTESGLRRSNFYGLTSRDFQKNSQDLVTQTSQWDVSPFLSITNKLRYGYTVTDYVASKPGTPNLSNPNPALWTVAATPASRYQVNRTLANQTDATLRFDTGPFNHTAVIGVEAQREDVSQDGYSGLTVECNPSCTTGITTNLWAPTTAFVSTVGTPVRNNQPAKTKVDTLSLYALDTISWQDRLILNVGTRIDNYAITRTAFGGAPVSRDDLMPNWSAGLTYKPVPQASLYVAYATSSNPVGSELDGNGDTYGGLAANNAVFSPERNTAMEAGAKWEVLDRHLSLNIAAFRTTKDNARETVGTVLQDTAAYEIRGVEVGFAGNITDRWSVFGGAVLMQSEVTASAIASSLGRPLANIAHRSANLLTKYKVTDDFTVGAQVTWTGEILGGSLAAVSYGAGTVNVGGVSVATPTGYNKLPGGTRFDVMAEYTFNKTFTAKVQVLNVFNETLYDAFYRSGTPYVYVAPGRVGLVSLQAKF